MDRDWKSYRITITIIIMLLTPNILHVNATQKKKISGITYSVTNNKKKTASVVKTQKNIINGIILDTVDINGKTYKVTSIKSESFKNRKKLKKLIVGKNVSKISGNAFYGDKKLSKIIIQSNKLKKIERNAFKNINKKAVFYVQKTSYKKLIMRKYVGWKKTMKCKIQKQKKSSKDKAKDEEDDDEIKAEDYSYDVVPLTSDVCSVFYIITDNPNPNSFDFVDENTVISKNGMCYIEQSDIIFSDVEYIDVDTKRVNQGYIFGSSTTDGGEWILENVVGNIHKKTNIKVNVPKLKSSTAYLVDTYTTTSMSFFEKMDAIQKGLDSISLYSGVYVLGQLEIRKQKPYYGISSPGYIEQWLYIANPYVWKNTKSLLLSRIYPFELDSRGFPNKMAEVAKYLDDSCSVTDCIYDHSSINVTYNGVTKSYGGQGMGKGKGITSDLINNRYTFDGSSNDAFNIRSLSDIRNKILEYGQIEVKEEKHDNDELKWSDVSDVVGSDGSYVRIDIGASSDTVKSGYAYLYAGDATTSFIPGYIKNAWYDGRYFGYFDYFLKGVTFGSEIASEADIVMKDVKIPIPTETQNGKKYYYKYESRLPEYEEKTGIWKGFMRFYYQEDSKTWLAEVYNNIYCLDENTKGYSNVDDEDLKKSFSLSYEEVKEMKIDRNANVDPDNYYIYDRTVQPGTKSD